MQVYFPTSSSTGEDLENMYEQIEDALKLAKSWDSVIVMGDFNAIIGERYGNRGAVKFGLGIRNERGEKLLDFCNHYNLIAVNTIFEVPKRRRYTWTSPGDINRYQINYILVKSNFSTKISSYYSYPGAEVDSDYKLVMSKCCLNHKKYQVKDNKTVKWDPQSLKDEQIKTLFANSTKKNLIRTDEQINWSLF